MANTLGDTLNSLSDPAQNPAVQAENGTVLDFHAELETLGHETNLNDTMHGLTNAGETFGLGKIGDDNLVTDTAQAPGDVVDGAAPVPEGAGLITDVGQTTQASGGFVQGVGSSLSNPDVVQDASNGVTGPVLDGATNGVTGGNEPLISASGGTPGSTPIVNGGVFGTPDGQSPINIAVGSGQNIADVNALPGDGSDNHLISGDAGSPNDSNPLAQAGVLTTTDSQSPLGVDLGNGQNIATVDALPNSDALPGANLTNSILSQDLSNGVTGGDSGSGESLVTSGAGAPDNSPIFNGGVLTAPDDQQPLSLGVADGQNITNINALSSDNPLNFSGTGIGGTSAGDHLISGDAGAPTDNGIVQEGVLTPTDTQSPVGADVLSGQNILSADALPHSDLLQFADLGGAGTDSLAGLDPSTAGLGNILRGDTATAPSGDQSALIDANTDGSASLVQIHDDNSSATLGLNNHAIV